MSSCVTINIYIYIYTHTHTWIHYICTHIFQIRIFNVMLISMSVRLKLQSWHIAVCSRKECSRQLWGIYVIQSKTQDLLPVVLVDCILIGLQTIQIDTIQTLRESTYAVYAHKPNVMSKVYKLNVARQEQSTQGKLARQKSDTDMHWMGIAWSTPSSTDSSKLLSTRRCWNLVNVPAK